MSEALTFDEFGPGTNVPRVVVQSERHGTIYCSTTHADSVVGSGWWYGPELVTTYEAKLGGCGVGIDPEL